MNDTENFYEDLDGSCDADAEELRRRQRRERLARMKRERERRLRMQRILLIAVPTAVVLALVCVVFAVARGKSRRAAENKAIDPQGGPVAEMTGFSDEAPENGDSFTEERVPPGPESVATPEPIPTPSPVPVRYSAQTTADTASPPEEVDSTNVVFLELGTGNILAQRDYRAVVNPASMTKVLTVLVAAEHVTDLDDTFTITIDITDYSYSHKCSSVGFAVGEVVTVRDLFYGTVLPSGGDAAVALATYVAGSHEAFVEMMNEKAEALGLSGSAHFTNCVGLYDEEHHCSVYDIAMIMEAAIDNDLCREVLGARKYTTSKTEEHPEGIDISNWFLRRIEDKDTGGEIVCAKTGFVVQSKNCAVSYGVDAGGNEYICATTGAHSGWRCIYDHVALYKAYAR